MALFFELVREFDHRWFVVVVGCSAEEVSRLILASETFTMFDQNAEGLSAELLAPGSFMSRLLVSVAAALPKPRHSCGEAFTHGFELVQRLFVIARSHGFDCSESLLRNLPELNLRIDPRTTSAPLDGGYLPRAHWWIECS